MKRSRILWLLCAGCVSAVGAASQTADNSVSDSDRAALREAVRFERYKLATARAQMQKEGRRAEVAPQSAEQPKTAPAKSDNKALQEAVQFERHKIAAARAQERKDTIESASAQPQKPQERRRYSRRSPPATEPRP